MLEQQQSFNIDCSLRRHSMPQFVQDTLPRSPNLYYVLYCVASQPAQSDEIPRHRLNVPPLHICRLSALCARGRLAPLLRATYAYPLRKHQPETALAGRVAAWHDPWGPFRFTGFIIYPEAEIGYQYDVRLSSETTPLPPVENFPTVIGPPIARPSLARRRLPPRSRRRY
jgi:hypothetical protein